MSRAKVVVLVILSMLAVTGLYYAQVQTSLNQVFVKLQQDNTRRASQLLQQSALNEVRSLKMQSIALSKIEASKKWVESTQTKSMLTSDLKNSGFLGMAFLDKAGKRQFDLKWISLQPEIIEDWSEYLISKIYQTIPYQRVPLGTIHFEKIENHQKRPVWIMAYHVDYDDQSAADFESSKSGVIVALLSNNSLATMGMAYRGFDYEFLLLNDDGFALNHSTSGYISASFKQYRMFDSNPFVKARYFETFFEQSEDRYWGIHQVLPQTNLRLAVSKRVHAFNAASTIFETKWLIGLFALILMAISIAFLFKNNIEEKYVLLKTLIINFSDGVTDIPEEWRQKIPNSVLALEKIYRREKSESEQQVEKIKLNTEREPDEGASVRDDRLDHTVVRSLSEDTSNTPWESLEDSSIHKDVLREVQAGPAENSAPETFPKAIDEKEKAPNSLNPSEAPSDHSGPEVAMATNSPEQEFEKLEESDTRDDVRILDEISAVQEEPPGGFWLQKIVADTLRELKAKLKSNNVNLALNFNKDQLIPIEGDPRHLVTALKHIISNAIEASSHQEEIVLKIVIRLNKDEVRIEIEDYGKGFHEQSMDQVFQPFFTTKDSPDHPGLGLTASKKLVENLGGYIDINQNKQIGSSVAMVLPVAGHALPGIERAEPTVSDLLKTSPAIVAEELDLQNFDEFQVSSATDLGGLTPLRNHPAGMPSPQELDDSTIALDVGSNEVENIADAVVERNDEESQDDSESMVSIDLEVKSEPIGMPPLPGESTSDLEIDVLAANKSSKEQAKELLDELVNMQVKVRDPKVK